MKPARLITWFQGAIDVLRSATMAAVLLAVYFILFLLSLFIPQISRDGPTAVVAWVEDNRWLGHMGQFLGFTDLQHAWILYGAHVLLFSSLLLCMLRRAGPVARSLRVPPEPPSSSSFRLHRQAASTLEPDQVAAFLRRKGYRTRIAATTVFALRGRIGLLGHWIFHAGLLILIAGGFLAALERRAFRGTIGIGEGESFDLKTARFLLASQHSRNDLPDLRFRVERLDVETQGNEVRRFNVQLSTPEGDLEQLAINHPYRAKPYQVLGVGFGFMPGWVIQDHRGRRLDGAWVKLIPFPREQEDEFDLGRFGARATVRFFPAPKRAPREAQGSSGELNDPRFEVQILRGDQEIFSGMLEPGQRIPFGRRLFFAFVPEIRRYGLFDVIYERQYSVVFASFGVIILGLLLRLLWIRKEILVECRHGSLQLCGRSEMLESLFEVELSHLAHQLTAMSQAEMPT